MAAQKRNNLGQYLRSAAHSGYKHGAPAIRRGALFGGRVAYRGTRATVNYGGRKVVGLSPSEYAELLRLQQIIRERGLSRDELYIAEVKRANILEGRLGAQTYANKQRVRSILKRLRA